MYFMMNLLIHICALTPTWNWFLSMISSFYWKNYNGTKPASFCSFQTQIVQKNCRLPQQDLNSDRRSWRWARGPLDHHHDPLIFWPIFGFTSSMTKWQIVVSIYQIYYKLPSCYPQYQPHISRIRLDCTFKTVETFKNSVLRYDSYSFLMGHSQPPVSLFSSFQYSWYRIHE